VDLTNREITGKEAEEALDRANITCNKNMIPFDPRTPFNPSGIRLGTPALTTRGMKEDQMKQVGRFIAEVIDHAGDETVAEKVKKDVRELCQAFPLYPEL